MRVLNLAGRGTDQEFRSNFEQEDGASHGGRARPVGQARTAAPLGALRNARSQVELGMWRGQSWCGRAGQVFGFGKPGVADRATANSLAVDRRGPRQDDQIVKTKPPAGNCSRILDQGLGPTRSH